MTRFEFDCISETIANHDFRGFNTFAVGICDENNTVVVCAGINFDNYKIVSIPFCEFKNYKSAEDMFIDIERRYNIDKS